MNRNPFSDLFAPGYGMTDHSVKLDYEVSLDLCHRHIDRMSGYYIYTIDEETIVVKWQ